MLTCQRQQTSSMIQSGILLPLSAANSWTWLYALYLVNSIKKALIYHEEAKRMIAYLSHIYKSLRCHLGYAQPTRPHSVTHAKKSIWPTCVNGDKSSPPVKLLAWIWSRLNLQAHQSTYRQVHWSLPLNCYTKLR